LGQGGRAELALKKNLITAGDFNFTFNVGEIWGDST